MTQTSHGETRTDEQPDGGFYTLKVSSSLCAASEFTVNGIDADKDDFGRMNDEDPEEASDVGCCGNMQFSRHRDPESVGRCLAKYGITREQYEEVAKALEEGLSFGNCCCCN